MEIGQKFDFFPSAFLRILWGPIRQRWRQLWTSQWYLLNKLHNIFGLKSEQCTVSYKLIKLEHNWKHASIRLMAVSHFLSCKSTTKNRQFMERANPKKDDGRSSAAVFWQGNLRPSVTRSLLHLIILSSPPKFLLIIPPSCGFFDFFPSDLLKEPVRQVQVLYE